MPLKKLETKSAYPKKSTEALPITDATKSHWGIANNIGQAFAAALNQSVMEKKMKR
jgi:hypothetical protein